MDKHLYNFIMLSNKSCQPDGYMSDMVSYEDLKMLNQCNANKKS